jgi:aminopeptidase N
MVGDDTLSNRHVLALAEGFWQPEHDLLTAPYVDRYFHDMPMVAGRRTAQVVARLAAVAYPRYAVTTSTADAADRLLSADGLPSMLRRAVLDGTDDLRRALAARAAAGG